MRAATTYERKAIPSIATHKKKPGMSTGLSLNWMIKSWFAPNGQEISTVAVGGKRLRQTSARPDRFLTLLI